MGTDSNSGRGFPGKPGIERVDDEEQDRSGGLDRAGGGDAADGFLRAALSEAENDALYEQELTYAREMAAKIGSGSRMAIFAD